MKGEWVGPALKSVKFPGCQISLLSPSHPDHRTHRHSADSNKPINTPPAAGARGQEEPRIGGEQCYSPESSQSFQRGMMSRVIGCLGSAALTLVPAAQSLAIVLPRRVTRAHCNKQVCVGRVHRLWTMEVVERQVRVYLVVSCRAETRRDEDCLLRVVGSLRQGKL